MQVRVDSFIPYSSVGGSIVSHTYLFKKYNGEYIWGLFGGLVTTSYNATIGESGDCVILWNANWGDAQITSSGVTLESRGQFPTTDLVFADPQINLYLSLDDIEWFMLMPS